MYNKIEEGAYKLLKDGGTQSQMHDLVEIIISVIICLNVTLVVVESLDDFSQYSWLLKIFRTIFFVFFLVEYLLRLWIADLVMNDQKHPVKSRLKYAFSFYAIIDLLALLPVLLGVTFMDFRIFRILRLLKITRLTGLRNYTDILSKVIKLKGPQLLSSLFIVIIFMLVAAVVVYDLESAAQPEVFGNVLKGLWWSISAITTIGYGDMYPITPLGKTFASLLSIFGVFLMAVPIGILTSGFFELAKTSSGQKEADASSEKPEGVR